MLLYLCLFRLCPMLSLHFCKKRKKIKIVFLTITAVYILCFVIAVWKIFNQEQWLGVLCLIISLFPHYLCYSFAVWLIIRCVWRSWSDRVWKRIYGIALMSVIFGIYTENYWNPKILQFFCNFFK